MPFLGMLLLWCSGSVFNSSAFAAGVLAIDTIVVDDVAVVFVAMRSGTVFMRPCA